MKTGEINFDDVSKSSVHDDLFEALCLLKRARNLIHEVKTEEELTDFNSRLDLTAINDYLKGTDITDIEDMAESLSIASVDLAYRALVDNCGGVADDFDIQSAIYKLYQLSKVFKQLANDNK